MSLIGIWPYHSFRDRCLLFVPMFTFSLTILVPQVSAVIDLFTKKIIIIHYFFFCIFYNYISHLKIIIYYNIDFDVAVVPANHRDES